MSSSIKSVSLRLVELEARENPSGTINAVKVGQTLSLTGDDNDNQITSITIVGGANPSVTITPDAGTTIDNLFDTSPATAGTPVTISGAVNSLLVRLKGGNDVFNIDPTADLALTGAITIDLGDGDNTLGMQTSGKLSATSLAVTTGDGLDVLNIAGGTLTPNTFAGDVTISMGVGRGDQDNPTTNISQATISRLDVQGVNGLRVTALEGDEQIRLIGTSVKNAFRGDGGEGIFDVSVQGGTIGSIVLDSVGIIPSNLSNGTLLFLGGVTVNRSVTVTSDSGLSLNFANSTTGALSMSAGTDGFLEALFQGVSTINGNVKAKAYSSRLNCDETTKLTVNGNISLLGASQSALSTFESEVTVRNLEVSSEDGNASVSLTDADPGTNNTLTVNGTMTIRGESASFTQYGGLATILTQLNMVATGSYADFSTDIGTSFYDAPGAKTTVVNGSLSISGATAAATITESELTTSTGILLQGTKFASFNSKPSDQVENPVVAGEFSKATGSKTTVQKGGVTVKSSLVAGYSQSEGDSTFATGISVVSTTGVANVGFRVGDGINSVGPKANVVGGAVTVQGKSVSLIQEGGNVSIAKGVKLLATKDVQFIATKGETHDREFNYSDVFSTTNISAGSLQVLGGSSEAQFRSDGGSLNVAGDLTITGKQQNRIRFGGATGTTIAGNLNVSGAQGAPDWFIVDTNLTVNKNTSINLGTGTNAINLGGDTGAVLFKGNLNLTTGNGSDRIVLKSVNVLGSTTITTGAGADLVSIVGNSTFTGLTTINTGIGDDRIEIANDTAATGPVTFTGKATIKAGDGNDTLELGRAVGSGGTANTRVVFSSVGSTIAGELHLNRFDDELSQFDPTNLTISGFVDPTP